jgi:superkiller protein 3
VVASFTTHFQFVHSFERSVSMSIRVLVVALGFLASAGAVALPVRAQGRSSYPSVGSTVIPVSVKPKITALRLKAQATPASAAAHLELGIALSDAGLWNEARAEFKSVLKLRPTDAAGLYNLGLTDLRAAQSTEDHASPSYYQLLDSAHNLLLQAAQLDSKLPKLHQHLGYLNHQAGDQEAALKEYQKAVEAEPHSAEAYNNLGSALADVEKYEDALEQYQRAFALAPKSPSILMNLDGAVRRAGKIKNFLTESEAAVRQDTDSIPNHLLYGLALYRTGEKDAALREFEGVLKRQPDLGGAHFYHGEILREKSEIGDAETEYARAAALDPDRAEFAERHAATLVDLGKLREAEIVLRRILRTKPEDASLHFQLGRVLQKLKQTSLSSEQFEQSSQLVERAHIQGQIAMNLLEGIRQLRAKNIPEAVERFKKAQSLSPHHPETNFYLGIALSQSGDVVNSTRAFEEALQRRPSSAEIHYNFGIALWQHQHEERAIGEFRKAVYLRPEYGLAHCALGLALMRSGFPEEGKAEMERSRELASCGSDNAAASQ